MGQIDFTNIIIDDFRKGNLNPFNKYIYILTHIHSDHLRGLNNSWSCGPIYCSKVTANLLMNKYPNLQSSIKVLDLQQQHKIILASNITVTITFFDANHCAGAVMVLLQGYFGRFLYTGDFRFNRKKFSSYTYLYPPENSNASFQSCSKQIDKLWLDNTFCNPRFHFMMQKQALDVILDFVKQQPAQKRIYIGMDNYGKQQALVHLAKQLDTLIVVNQIRYQNLIAMEFDRELFTTIPQEGRIQVVQKPILHDKLLQNQDAIGLVMSGWSLKQEWKKVRGTNQPRIFYVPYSLHSNYQEIVSFLKSIKPSMIQPIVMVTENSQGNVSNQSMYNTQGNLQTFNNLVKTYTSPMSQLYKRNLQDKQFQQLLKKSFGFDRKSAQINKAQLNLNTVYVKARTRGKGFKFQQRNEQQIQRVKDQINKARRNKIKMPEEVVINSSSGEDSSQIQILQNFQIRDQFYRKNIKNKKQKQENEYFEHIIKISKPNWKQLNKIQCIFGQKQIQKDFKQEVKHMLLQL